MAEYSWSQQQQQQQQQQDTPHYGYPLTNTNHHHHHHTHQDEYLKIAVIALITAAAFMSIVLICLIGMDMYDEYRDSREFEERRRQGRRRRRGEDDDELQELSADFTSTEFRDILKPRTKEVSVRDITGDEETGCAATSTRDGACFTIVEGDETSEDDEGGSSISSSSGQDALSQSQQHGNYEVVSSMDSCDDDEDDDNHDHHDDRCRSKSVRLELEECCAICLEPYSENDQVSWSPGCNHHFHTTCMVEYAKATTNKRNKKKKRRKQVDCPMCREPFLRVGELDDHDDEEQQQEQQEEEQQEQLQPSQEEVHLEMV